MATWRYETASRKGSIHHFLKRKKPRFSEVGWSADHLRDFADALPLFTNLKTLYLNGNNFGDEGCSDRGGHAPGTLCLAPSADSALLPSWSCPWRDQCVHRVVKLDLTMVFLRYIFFFFFDGRSNESLSRDLSFVVPSCNLLFRGDARVDPTQEYVELACASNKSRRRVRGCDSTMNLRVDAHEWPNAGRHMHVIGVGLIVVRSKISRNLLLCVRGDCVVTQVCVHAICRTPQQQVTDTFVKMGDLVECRTIFVGALRPSQKFEQMPEFMCKVPVVLLKLCIKEFSMCRSALLVTVGRAAASFWSVELVNLLLR